MRKVILLSASFLFLLNACTKEGELNPDFVNDTSSSSFTNSIEITSRTVIGDSILADRVSTALAGVYKDSVFGISTVSTVIQPLLPSNFLVFGESDETLVTDSVILSLQYSGIFGDTSAQTLNIFRVNELLNSDNDYPSNYVVSVESNPISTQLVRPNLSDDLFILSPDANGNLDSIRLDPQLRLRLDNAIGDEILAESGQQTVSNNENFVDFFKGLSIQPNPNSAPSNNQNAILYFAITSSDCKMSIYYTATDGQGGITKKVVDFPINSESVRFNTFSHDFTQGSVNSTLQGQVDSNHAYVQSMAGIQTLLKFPGIETFRDSNIVINKAELELPVINDSYLVYGEPDKLVVAAKDENGTLQFIEDFFEGPTYFGGDFDPVSNSYKFNISRYIQGLINGSETKDELSILVSGSAVKADRIVLGSPNNRNNQGIRLNLYYSKTE